MSRLALYAFRPLGTLRPATAQPRERLPARSPSGWLDPAQDPILAPTRSVGSSGNLVRGDGQRTVKGPGPEARFSGPGLDSSPKPLGPGPVLWGLLPRLQVVREKLQKVTSSRHAGPASAATFCPGLPGRAPSRPGRVPPQPRGRWAWAEGLERLRPIGATEHEACRLYAPPQARLNKQRPTDGRGPTSVPG